MKTKDIILVAMFAALTAIGTFIKIPVPYVDFTLQYFFCAFAGILLGSRLGAMSQIVYVVIGLIGVPVFTEGGGYDYIFKPSFGYLIGFIVSAYVIGRLTEGVQKLTLKRSLSAVLTGLFFVYLFGVTYLYMILNIYAHKNVSFVWAIIHGFVLFIGKDLVLSVIIALAALKIVPVIKLSDR